MVIGIVAGVVGLLLAIFIGRWCMGRVRRTRRQRSEKMQARVREIASEYDASVHFAINSLPVRKYEYASGADEGTEMTRVGTPSDSSRTESMQSSNPVEDIKNSISGFFSPTPSEQEAEETLAKQPRMPLPHSKTTAKVAQAPAYPSPDCPICLTSFKPGDEIRELPCGHVFRRACIDDWLMNKGRAPAKAGEAVRGLATCPLCKAAPIDIPSPPSLGEGQSSTSRGGPSFHPRIGASVSASASSSGSVNA